VEQKLRLLREGDGYFLVVYRSQKILWKTSVWSLAPIVAVMLWSFCGTTFVELLRNNIWAESGTGISIGLDVPLQKILNV